MTGLFDYINSVSHEKKDIMTGTENDDLAEAGYDPFMTNVLLSRFPDCIMYVNEMNRLFDLSKRQQYEFYLHGLRKRKRFKRADQQAKADRARQQSQISTICDLYKCNRVIARQYLDLLTQEQIESIQKQQEQSGIQNERRHF